MLALVKTWFSPPAWGWSEFILPAFYPEEVFPTRVGMVRAASFPGCTPFWGFPHPRGDGPLTDGIPPPVMSFSPPAWGWSASATTELTQALVFPTRVGMVRLV